MGMQMPVPMGLWGTCWGFSSTKWAKYQMGDAGLLGSLGSSALFSLYA